MSRWGRARRDATQSIPDHIDTYRSRSEFLELRTHARRLTDENERLRHRLAGCLGRNSLGRGAAAVRSPRRPQQRRAAASPQRRAAPAPAVDEGVKDLIKNYRRALRRADARAVDLQARATIAEARAAAAERRAEAAELRAAEAEAPPLAPTQEVPRAAPTAASPTAAPPPPRPRTPDTPDSDDGVAALRDEVSGLDAEIDVLRGALKAAGEGDRATARSLEERAREAARAILAASSRR